MNKKQRKQDKVLKNTFIFLGIILVGFILFFIILNYINSFEYQGVKFEINKNEVRGQTLYKTSIPVIYGGEEREYNLYLREDPRELEKKVPFAGEIVFRKNLVLKTTTDNLFCNGEWNYFQLQLKNLEIFDIRLSVKNDSLKYEPIQSYMFMTINEGNQTEIRNIGGNAYDINVNNCEIASIADRLLLDAIIKNNELYNN